MVSVRRMKVLIYESFEFMQSLGQNLAEGFTQAGHETLVIPSRMGALSDFHGLFADLIVVIGSLGEPGCLAPYVLGMAAVPGYLAGSIATERSIIDAATTKTPIVLVHGPHRAHPLCEEFPVCLAIGRTLKMDDEKCLPMPFASSIRAFALSKVWDLVFIGTWGPMAQGDRGQEHFLRCAEGRRRLIFGGEPLAKGWIVTVPGGLLPWLYGASRVGINPLYAAQLLRAEVNERVYDLARCGVVQVTNSPAAAEALDGHVIVGSVEEFPEIVRGLLDHDRKAPDIVSAQRHVMSRHTWAHRAEAMIEAIA